MTTRAATAPTSSGLLTIPQTAAHLQVGINTVYRLIASGELAPTDVAPKGSRKPKTRVSREAADAFIKARTRQ